MMIPGTTPTHPLFPADQIFLWLPGLSSSRFAFCTGNKLPEPSPGEGQDLEISSSPPFPVSPATFIAWDAEIEPPCPYHPIPVARALSSVEMDQLARRVIQLAGEDDTEYPHRRHVLRNEKKCIILAALAEMGCLSGFVPPPGLTPVQGTLSNLKFDCRGQR